MNNELGFDEVVDWASDVIEVTAEVREALKDGFQWQDSFVLLKNQAKLTEIVTDADDFLDQLMDLTTEEADQAIAQISDRTGVEQDQVNFTIVFGMQICNRAYRLIDHNVNEVNGLKADVQRFVGLVRGEKAA